MYKKYNQLGDEGQENAPVSYSVMEIQSSEHKHDLLRKNAIVCIDVYANWCQPCKQMEPSYAVLAKKLSMPGKCMIVKENLEAGLSREFDVQAVPLFLIFFRGRLHKRISGADLQAIEETLHELFGQLNETHAPHSRESFTPTQHRQMPGQPSQQPVPPHQGQQNASYKQNYGLGQGQECVGAQCTYNAGDGDSPSFNTNSRSVRQFNNNKRIP